MKERDPDKEKRSVLGLGGLAPGSDLSKWRPSKAGEVQGEPALWQSETIAREQNPAAQREVTAERDSQPAQRENVPPTAGDDGRMRGEGVWRPSEAVKERLGSLSPRRRKRFALPRSMRLVASVILLVIGIYVFVKLWTMPTGLDLHPALAGFGVALVLLLIAAIVNGISRRRRSRDDEKSTLRL